MKKVRISADLERRLRASPEPLAAEVVALLDQPAPSAPPAGLGYKDLVILFRANLGAALALPPNPSTGWIIRQVARARDLGLDGESIRQVCERGRRLYSRGPIELEFLLRIAPRLLASTGEPELLGGGGAVHTGRGAQDDD